MQNVYSSDRPVEKREEDRFQRYQFSKRIAETIIHRGSDDGLVIGIYGAWGDGKSSILNFIEGELSHSDNIIIIKFNPWRYKDEELLLKSFFISISKSLDQELSTNSEKLGKFVEKYGSLTSVLGFDFSGAGKGLADVDLEDLKIRVNSFIKESEKKIVIIIDDIDRLDKNEIYSLIRLVKINADFHNTFYILSFDDNMVANAINERFGQENKQAGENFLEKIIQVPLKIPKPQSSDLQEYSLSIIEKVLIENDIKLSDSEMRRYINVFETYILPKIKTPRYAVRYGNSISFSIPLLKDEINIVDLLLIEAVKIIYPDIYKIINQNQQFFARTYSLSFNSFGETDKADMKKILDEMLNSFNENEKILVKGFLSELFPSVAEVLDNSFIDDIEQIAYKHKRISSSRYFNRYFAYCVLKDQFSDVEFNRFLEYVENNDLENAQSNFLHLVKIGTFKNVVIKLRSIIGDLSWEEKNKLIDIIAVKNLEINEEIIEEDGFFSFVYNPQSQSAMIIRSLLEDNENKSEVFNKYKEIITNTSSVDFAMQLYISTEPDEVKGTYLLIDEERNELFNFIRKKALYYADGIPLHEKYPDYYHSFFRSWKIEDPEQQSAYFEQLFSDNSEKIIEFIRLYTLDIHTTKEPKRYRSDLELHGYNELCESIDKDLLFNKIMQNYSDELLQLDVEFFGTKFGQTDKNLLKQFEFWYLKDQEQENNEE
ncbi:P-loop NTPase fold protein [Chryseobacterium cucumeris]|uniref:KAP family P-loop NTPase fold protein n=1 Tax=Chryseobacterium cucumeris TaxID=1813611 RepID=UPI00192D523E|nr:P-loop NTPase fold protein [Chryseobacterium cucumeris]QRA41155.1 hypothetical protein JNG87_10925 [Chryseobacterium cucumeris]